jgi:predicted ribosome quality control (RQC) complex YloA/Tae2 family protein
MKFVMSNLDINIMVDEISSFGDFRVQNIYDVDGNFISFKIRLNDKRTKFLMIDAGKKFYLSDSKIENKRKMPSGFVMKMRKHLENKRIIHIRQINNDRVIEIAMGYSNIQYYLMVEFYASGNLIFTDENYKILGLYHTHIYKDQMQDEKIIVRTDEIYPIHKSTTNNNIDKISKGQFLEWYNNMNDINKNIYSIKKICNMSPLLIFGKEYIEHSLLELNINPEEKYEDTKLDMLINYLKNNNFKNDKSGYIIYEKNKAVSFVPILFNQYKTNINKNFCSFSKTIEEYHREISGNNLDITVIKKNKNKHDENKNEKKLKNIRGQINKMKNKYEELLEKAIIFENNISIVSDILKFLVYMYDNDIKLGGTNILTSSGTNIIPENIKRTNEFILQISDEFQIEKITYENTNKIGVKERKIYILFIPKKYLYECSLNLSAYDHVSQLYKMCKNLEIKINSTIKLINEDIKNNTQNNVENNAQNNNGFNILKIRKEYWYEKYHWFFSSEGLLIVVGKNIDQNEELVKKHMEKNDLYIHSDARGSGSGIIKQKNKNIPLKSLEEGGAFLICHTNSWKSGIPERSFWVYSEQVSKTPETGEYLTKGSFIIRGQKNILPIPKLELGLTLMFKIKGNDILMSKYEENAEYAIPMVAPYKIINNNKFKIKIIPGTGKIDKTIKNSIINIFHKLMNKYEERLIKNISFEEYQRILLSGIKIF